MKRLPLFALLIVITATWFWFVTYGTGNLRGEQPEVWGTAFDYLARSLSHGDVDVPADAIGFEGIQRNNKTYLYFGAFPAIIRMLPNFLWPEMFGYWSRVSCFTAALLSLAGICLIINLSLRSNAAIAGQTGRRFELYLTAAFGLASPLLFLVSDSMIFFEPILWGLCFSLWGIAAITGYTNRLWPPYAALLILSCCAAAALNSRITFAIPLYLSLGILVITEVKRRRSALFPLISCLLPALAGLALQLWYNHARFDSFTSTRSFQMGHSGFALFGAEFNLLAIPISLLNYGIFRPGAISLEPPFFHSLPLIFALPGLFLDWHERVIPLMVCSPWLLWIGGIGALTVWRQGPSPRRLVCLAFTFQAIVVLSWHFITQRYLGDLLPLFVLLTSIAISDADPSLLNRQKWLFLILLLIGLLATPLSTVDFHLNAVGDTGRAKGNRPLLYSLFYSPPVAPGSGTPLLMETNQEGCAIDKVDSVRGYNLNTGSLLLPGCLYQASISPGAKTVKMAIALTDHSHECEGERSHLFIRAQDGTPLYYSKTLTQRTPFVSVAIPVQDLNTITFLFEGSTASCARGMIINPIAS